MGDNRRCDHAICKMTSASRSLVGNGTVQGERCNTRVTSDAKRVINAGNEVHALALFAIMRLRFARGYRFDSVGVRVSRSPEASTAPRDDARMTHRARADKEKILANDTSRRDVTASAVCQRARCEELTTVVHGRGPRQHIKQVCR